MSYSQHSSSTWWQHRHRWPTITHDSLL